ncbi:hypothetical protein, partial [Gluconacetobacter entanii]
SVSTKRSIQALNHMQMLEKSIIPNRPQKASKERRLFEKGGTQKLLLLFKYFPSHLTAKRECRSTPFR